MGSAEINTHPTLYNLVFGESVLNDAVSIVLFKTFMQLYDSRDKLGVNVIGPAVLQFVWISCGSLLCGVLTGLLCCFLFKHTKLRAFPEYEISMLLLFAYGSYALAESLGLSGIVSLFFNGVVLAHYNRRNLSPVSQVTAHNIFRSFSVLSDFMIYSFIGMGVFTGRLTDMNVSFLFLCLALCFISRFFNIFPLSYFANLFRSHAIPRNMQTMMWFSGLRGAISFALVSHFMMIIHTPVGGHPPVR